MYKNIEFQYILNKNTELLYILYKTIEFLILYKSMKGIYIYIYIVQNIEFLYSLKKCRKNNPTFEKIKLKVHTVIYFNLFIRSSSDCGKKGLT